MKNYTAKLMFVILFSGAVALTASGSGTVAPVSNQPIDNKNVASTTAEQVQKDSVPGNAASALPRGKMKWSKDAVEKINSAASGTSEKQTSPMQGKETSAARLVLAFVIMGLLLFGMYYILKRYGKRMTGQDNTRLQVLSKIYVDNKNTVILVKCYEDEFLIGVNSTSPMTLIQKFKQIDGVPDLEDSPVPEDLSELEGLDFKEVHDMELKKVKELKK